MSDDFGAIWPFQLEVPQRALDDLADRLTRTRWPEPAPEPGWTAGVPLAYLRELAAYWATGYDWRAEEAKINAFPQFTTTIDHQRIHFVHLRSPEPSAFPLLVIHGWPGSIVEFLRVFGPLADPAAYGGEAGDAFHVIAPSIPGFGPSGPASSAGWDVPRVAGAFAQLMARLGYSHYGAHGGDWGALISRELGRAAPHQVAGVHLTMIPSGVATSEPGAEAMGALPEVEQERVRASLARRARANAEDIGFGLLQATKPQTVGYALHDSPVGQLAWIVDKFKAWSDCTDRPEEIIERDQMLTDVSLYWFTGTGVSSARFYYESAHTPVGWQRQMMAPSTVPTGVAVFPKDTSLPVRHLAERTNRIVHWSNFDRGGHFPAMEVPDLLIDDLRAFFRPLR
ncbi:MAG: epoxide hydrolase family protein [Actinomycetota bacterium]